MSKVFRPWCRHLARVSSGRRPKARWFAQAQLAVGRDKLALSAVAKSRTVADALQFLHDEDGQVNSNLSVWEAVLRYCSYRQDEKNLLDVWQRMPERTPSGGVAMITYFSKQKKYVEAENIFQHLLEHHTNDVPLYTAMISSYGSASRPDLAEECFQKLLQQRQETGIRVDQVAYNTIMTAHAKKGQYREARRHFEAMCDSGLRPNARHFTTLITACSLKQKTDVADLVFQEMKQHPDVTMSTEAYNALIAVHRHSLSRCRSLYAELRQSPLAVTIQTFNSLLAACVTCKDVVSGRQFVADFEGRGLVPDGRTIQHLAVLSKM